MADVKQLLREYIQRQEAGGEPDAAPFLERAEAGDLEMLATLIDGYWMTRPPKQWDAEAAQGSPAARVANRVAETLASEQEEPAAAWANLRHRARIKRPELVKQLARELGVAKQEQKVGSYYHQLENGWLDLGRVSPKVFDSLGGILGASADWLRRISEPSGGEGPSIKFSVESEVMARTGKPDPDLMDEAPAAPAGKASKKDEWDEVDELFRGG